MRWALLSTVAFVAACETSPPRPIPDAEPAEPLPDVPVPTLGQGEGEDRVEPPAPGRIRVAGLQIVGDRGEAGDSNGLADAGERVELRVRLESDLAAPTPGGALTVTAGPGATVWSEGLAYEAMAPGQAVEVGALLIVRVDPDVADGQEISLAFEVADSRLGPLAPAGARFTAHNVVPPAVLAVAVHDAEGAGDGDAMADPGERVAVVIDLELPPTRWTLDASVSGNDPLFVEDGSAGGQRWAGGEGAVQAQFVASVDPGAPPDSEACLTLFREIEHPDGGRYRYEQPVCLEIGEACDGPEAARVCGPDLVFARERTQGDIWIDEIDVDESSCAALEGCVDGLGRRRLLRFGVGSANVGTEDLRLGDPADHPDLYEWSPCHEHYHLQGYADYSLRAPLDPDQIIAPGHKQAFCLVDTQPYWEDDPAIRQEALYSCASQGISRGWMDVYAATLDCQWIDITDVAAGDYTLRLHVNPAGVIPETTAANNITEVAVTVPGELDIASPCPEVEVHEGQARMCGWRLAHTAACEPGALMVAGCNGAPACGELGRCEGDPLLRVCAGEAARCLPGTAVALGDEACDTDCPLASFRCPDEAAYTVWSAADGPEDPENPHVCELQTRVVTAADPCPPGASIDGVARPCGWTPSPPEACEPGDLYRLGCTGTADAEPRCGAGPACTGDPMLRLCEGEAPCRRGGPAELATNDDSCGTRCPSVPFECPPSGAVRAWTAAFRTTGHPPLPATPATCTPTLLPVR